MRGQGAEIQADRDWIEVESAGETSSLNSATTDIQIHTTATDRARLCREHLLIIPAQAM